jgi:hypothetical protein
MKPEIDPLAALPSPSSSSIGRNKDNIQSTQDLIMERAESLGDFKLNEFKEPS